MSAAANWSYTSRATHWPKLSRDDWTGAVVYGAPVAFACDYSAEAKRLTDEDGVEFTTRQVLHTERATVQRGDMVLIGTSTVTSPITAGAFEVRSVTRYADTFDQVADDYMVAT